MFVDIHDYFFFDFVPYNMPLVSAILPSQGDCTFSGVCDSFLIVESPSPKGDSTSVNL